MWNRRGQNVISPFSCIHFNSYLFLLLPCHHLHSHEKEEIDGCGTDDCACARNIHKVAEAWYFPPKQMVAVKLLISFFFPSLFVVLWFTVEGSIDSIFHRYSEILSSLSSSHNFLSVCLSVCLSRCRSFFLSICLTLSDWMIYPH